jgi:Galactose oxidase, central domain
MKGMSKLNDHTRRRLFLILALAGLASIVSAAWERVAQAQSQVMSPSWSFTDALNTNRYLHTATLLRNGKVLVVGGAGWLCTGTFPLPGSFCYSTVYSGAEVYDVATGTWSVTGSLSRRAAHTATLLANGQVLVAGGANWGYDVGGYGYLKSAELYDPASGRWRPTGSFSAIRGGNTATLLPNGKVLAVGISNIINGSVVYAAELYDPAAETWSSTDTPTIFLAQVIFGQTPQLIIDFRQEVIEDTLIAATPAD